jgi:LysM repeat protein
VNGRATARVVAPAAFLVGVTLAVVVVRAGLDDGVEATPTTQAVRTRPTTRATTRAVTTRAQTTETPARRFATVERGDTLDQIALDNDTTVEQLLALNPGLDPRELQIGQHVRVR